MFEPNLDRFSQGLKDAQEEPVIESCHFCYGELYEGDKAYKDYFDNVISCESCLKEMGRNVRVIFWNEIIIGDE